MAKRICDLETADIRSIIERALEHDDNFVNAPRLLQAFTKAANGKNDIQRAIQALNILCEKHPDFFRSMPYRWAFDLSVYRRPMDASLQVQALQLLSAFSKHSESYPVEENSIGQVVCTMAISPNTFGRGPRVLPTGPETAGGIIVFPSGWFTALAVFLEIERCHTEQDTARLEGLVKGLYVRAVTEEAFRQERDRLDDLDIPVGCWDLIQDVMARNLVELHPSLTEAIFDLRSLKSSPGRSIALDRAAGTFAIAHEVSHILRGDHQRLASNADESLADNIAFDILAYCPEWKRMNQEIPLQDGLAKSALACSVFIFASLMHLSIHSRVTGCGNAEIELFRERAKSLQQAAQAQPIPIDQQHACTEHAIRLTSAREWAVKRIYALHDEQAELRDELCQEAFKTGVRQFT